MEGTAAPVKVDSLLTKMDIHAMVCVCVCVCVCVVHEIITCSISFQILMSVLLMAPLYVTLN